MLFTSYLIESNPDKSVHVFLRIIVALIAGVMIAGFAGFTTVASYLFLAIAVGGVVFAVIKKGYVQEFDVSENKLTITASTIEIAGVVYELEKIRGLQFFIHSYAGLSYMGQEYSTSDGMNNYVSFTNDDKAIKCRFFLEGSIHTVLLYKAIKELQRNIIDVTVTSKFA